MKKEILLTGASGFLGSHFFQILNGSDFLIRDINEFFETRVDISKPFAFPPDVNFDSVIHVAGKAHSIPQNDQEAKEFYEINVEGTKRLCGAIEKLSRLPKEFVFVSTVAVYGLECGTDINEEFALHGQTPYAKSKILAERYVEEWANKLQIKLGIIRLPLIVGHNPPGNLGAMIRGIKKGRYLSIGDASFKKSVVMADDIARVIPKIFEVGGTYNLTDGYHPSFGELERAIAYATGKSIPKKIPLFVARLLAKLGDILPSRTPINSTKLKKITSTLTYSDAKAREKLNWSPSNVLNRIGEIV